MVKQMNFSVATNDEWVRHGPCARVAVKINKNHPQSQNRENSGENRKGKKAMRKGYNMFYKKKTAEGGCKMQRFCGHRFPTVDFIYN